MYYPPILHAYPSWWRIQVYVYCTTIKNEPPCTILYALHPYAVKNDKFCIRILDVEIKGKIWQKWRRPGEFPVEVTTLLELEPSYYITKIENKK